ncbi:MAG: hypothetical protein WD059_12395 [Balneolaceae bacterium]
MKYQILLLLVALISLSMVNELQAQITGGGLPGSEPNEEEIAEPEWESLFARGVVWKIGWANPKGNFGITPKAGDNYEDIFSSNAGLGAQKGFAIGLEVLKPLNVHQQFNTVKTELGLKYGFNYTNNKLDWTEIGGQWDRDATYYAFHVLDAKLGLIAAISPVQNLAFDVFYNPMLSLILPGEIDVNSDSYQERVFSFDTELAEGDLPFGVRHGLGFNIRFSAIVFSVETTWGALGYNYQHQVIIWNSDGTQQSRDTEIYESDMSNNTTMVSIGVAF